MSSTAYPHEHDDCDSCRAFDADLLVDVLDQDGVPGQNSRWCKRCAGPLLARLVLQGSTAVVAALNAPLPRRESVASEVRRRRAAGKPSSTWTVDFAEEVLRLAQPSASVLLRALVDEGGTATEAVHRTATTRPAQPDGARLRAARRTRPDLGRGTAAARPLISVRR
jgi:hypothetical protein